MNSEIKWMYVACCLKFTCLAAGKSTPVSSWGTTYCTVTHQMWVDLTLPSAPERGLYLTPAHCDLQRWQVTKWETKKWDSMNLLEQLEKRLAVLSLAELEHR